MYNIRLVLQIIYWLIVKAWKHVVTYPYIRSLGANKAQANHMTFCTQDDEEWTLAKFHVLDSLHYGSEHDVTCPHCGYHTTAKRAWLRADAWPGDLGSTYDDALKKAIVCDRNT